MTDHTVLLERAHRAGEVAQALFYTFNEHTWAYDMSSVCVISDQHDELVMVEVILDSNHVTSPEGKNVYKQQAGGGLTKFPQEAFNSTERFVKHSLLADRRSIWAFVFMRAAVLPLFEGLVNDAEHDIKEVLHYLPGNTLLIVQHKDRLGFEWKCDDLPYPDEDADGDLKGAYRITLKDGTKVALDLTRAQFNLPYDTVMPWTTYLEYCASDIKYRIPFRSHYKKHMDNIINYNTITHLSIIRDQIESFNSLLSTCEVVLGFDLKDLPAEPIECFPDRKHGLIHAIADFLNHSPQDFDSEAPGCVIAPFSLHHRSVSTSIADCEPVFLDMGNMKKFSWSKLSDMIKIPGNLVTYREKKKAKLLLQHRYVYKMPEDCRLVFLVNKMPLAKVPGEYVSENPFGQKRK